MNPFLDKTRIHSPWPGWNSDGPPFPPPGQRTRLIPRCGPEETLACAPQCAPLVLRYAEGDQNAVSEEHQPSARTHQPCRLRYPPVGLAPHAGPVRADTKSNEAPGMGTFAASASMRGNISPKRC